MSYSAAARRAHEAILALKAEEAKAILASALRSDPSSPDLLCEQAILDCYLQREFIAAEAYSRTAGAENREMLRQILRNHFYCCSLQNPLDARVGQHYARFSQSGEQPPENVGIDVTAILIVKNEEQRLPTCLASLKGVASQIVVVDTGSTDRTVEIAEGFGATLGYFEWCDDYAAARNESLKLATGQWALWIDADEELNPAAVPAINRAIVRPQFGGYYTEIVNFTDDRTNSNEFVHSAIRLFRNVPGVKFTEAIHEQVKPSLVDLGLPWATIDGRFIAHHGYRPSEMEAKGKIDKTIALLQRVVENDRENAFQWFNLANAHLIGARYDEAVRAAEECAKRLDAERDFGPLTYQVWACSLSHLGELEACLKVCDAADAAGYGGILNEFERASILARAGRFYEAIIAADKCIAAPWPKGKAGDRGIFTYKRYLVRGQILSDLDRLDEAQQMFEIALAADPDCAAAVYSRAHTYERAGQASQAADWYRRGTAYADTREVSEQGLRRCMVSQSPASGDTSTLRDEWESDVEDLDKWTMWVASTTTTEDALAAFDALVIYHKPSAEVYVEWGRLLETAGKTDTALERYSSAIKQNPALPIAYFNAGDLLYSKARYLDAAHMYESGLRYAPEHAEGWFTLGNCLAKLGLKDGALTCYHQTLGRNGMHTGALNNVAVLTASSKQLAA